MKKVKCYRCPIDKKVFKNLETWTTHMEKFHANEIPKQFTTSQYFYYLITGRDKGRCIVCHHETTWNDQTQKYNRFCTNPKCKEEYREMFKGRMINKYGKVHLLNDPEKQRDMLRHKKMSGVYTFEDGGKVEYTGTYEKDFLFMLDKFLHFSSTDILGPSPHTYYYVYKNAVDVENEGLKFYLPDFYIPTLNLEIEIKQNTNMHPKLLAIDKVKENLKDDIMIKNPTVNYIKIVEKNYSNFFELLLKLREYNPKDDEDPNDDKPMKQPSNDVFTSGKITPTNPTD